jgi:hypothetical protein
MLLQIWALPLAANALIYALPKVLKGQLVTVNALIGAAIFNRV